MNERRWRAERSEAYPKGTRDERERSEAKPTRRVRRMRGACLRMLLCAGSLVLFLPVMAWASQANVYIAQNSAGTGTGDSCANAKAVSFFNTAANWGSGATQIGPGTTVHLCGSVSSNLIFQGSGTAGSPATLLFEPNAKISVPIMGNASWSRAGIYANANYIIIDGGTNGVIESTDNGTGRGNQVDQDGIWLYGCNNCEVKNLTITGMYVRMPLSSDEGGCGGIYASGNHVRIHDNQISEANTGIAYNYPGSSMTQDVKIYNNKISRISNGITFGSGNTNALADDVQIYGNDITDEYVWDGILPDGSWFHNDGIQLWAVHDGSLLTNLKIYNNYVHGDLGRHTTGWIFVEGNIPDAQIYNNLLVCTGTSYPANGMITASGKIYNNTIATLSPGICVNSGARSEIYNNLMYNCGCGIGIHSPDANTRIDYNLYTYSDGFSMATVDPNGGAFGFYYSPSQWQTATGFDTHSKFIDPKMVDPVGGNFHLQSSSPAINAGTSAVSAIVILDRDGNSRPQGAGWDIGAYEYISTSILYGDVSENGSVTAYDASLAAQYAVGLNTLTSTQITKADVSGNSSVTAYDASLIAQYAVGLISKFPAEG